MTVKRTKSRTGLTLIETMTAILILLVAVVGTSAYRYDAALSARKADEQAIAARTALLLCEGWRGASDPCAFDPMQLASVYSTSALTIYPANDDAGYVIHQVPEGFTVLGAYKVVTSQADYYALLSWKDVSAGLRALNIIVAWDQRHSKSSAQYYSSYDNYKFFKLTTYISE